MVDHESSPATASESGQASGIPSGAPDSDVQATAAVEQVADARPRFSVQELRKDATTLLEKAKVLGEKAAVFSKRLQQEGDALGKEAIGLDKEIKAVRVRITAAAEADDVSTEDASEISDIVLQARAASYEADVRGMLPHKASGLFMRMFLGEADVLCARQDTRLRVKEEYHRYRDTTAWLFLFLPAALLFLKHRYWHRCFPGLPVQAYQGWLLFFYTSLALRENVLRINGSDIRPWWIQHHYWAMFMVLVSLTMGLEGPDCEAKQQGVVLFLGWSILQGVAMLLQNRYQRQRLYTRIALGKAGRMDVVWGESAGVKGQLWLLYPVLFALQATQFGLGVSMLKAAITGPSGWQIPTLGVLLMVIAVGNFVNTVATVLLKAKMKAKMRRRGKRPTQDPTAQAASPVLTTGASSSGEGKKVL